MQNILSLFSLILLLNACKTSQNDSGQNENSSQGNNQHLTYEVLIKEPGFIAWKKNQPQINTYKLGFLKEKNTDFINNFNKRVDNSEYDKELYLSEINYDENREYGKEVHYNLYNYFIYFQEKYKQDL
ncbi:DUF6146 family protein [Haloflavibacter putidus]|uniref:Uncharacterized protein n=1 Tax=Haloflavibacter putidus TaxID=2576776 RepID=A0A507ZUK5_9FLAO|nr:DUF6146 family protein [Haloflavibacter putidus]TQD40163.1 hypothetical protein FKR84_02905 [Haloflavibacter putidus]